MGGTVLLVALGASAAHADDDRSGLTGIGGLVPSSLGNLVEGTVKDVAEIAKPVTDPVREVTKPVTDPVREVTKPVTETVKETVKTADQVVAEVSEPLKPVTEPVNKTVDAVVEPVTQTVKPVTETVKDVANEVTEPVGEVVRDVTQTPPAETERPGAEAPPAQPDTAPSQPGTDHEASEDGSSSSGSGQKHETTTESADHPLLEDTVGELPADTAPVIPELGADSGQAAGPSDAGDVTPVAAIDQLQIFSGATIADGDVVADASFADRATGVSHRGAHAPERPHDAGTASSSSAAPYRAGDSDAAVLPIPSRGHYLAHGVTTDEVAGPRLSFHEVPVSPD